MIKSRYDDMTEKLEEKRQPILPIIRGDRKHELKSSPGLRQRASFGFLIGQII
jgi:hypothetical protein